MLRYSVMHPMPNGDIFQFSSHHSMAGAEHKIKLLEGQYRNHPDRFESWFNPKNLKIRDNMQKGWQIP